MNNQPEPGAHPVFEALQRKVAEGSTQDSFIAKAKLYVSFLLNPGTVADPAPDAPEPDDFNNPDNRPGRFLTLLCMVAMHTLGAACSVLVVLGISCLLHSSNLCY